jgi:NSS family neurotransmitter:Na+ symporter
LSSPPPSSTDSSPNQWKSNLGYIWAVLGSAVGFANLLSFSAQCYKNGGGAFLIPSVLAYLLLGIPLLMLEASIGQYLQLPFVSAYRKIKGSLGASIGWFAIISCLMIGGFYVVLTGYSLSYIYYSLFDLIPTDTISFFKNHVIGDSGSIYEFGSLSIPALLSTITVLTLTYFILTKNIQSGLEKFCSFVMPLMTILIVLFAIISSNLPGAAQGLSYYFTPDFSRLKDFGLWRDLFGQLFFSLSLGLGIITGYSRYNAKEVNLIKAIGWVALGDFLISLISGIVIFSCLGFLSQQSQTPFDQIVKSDSAFEIGFIIFPVVIARLSDFIGGASHFVGALFFFAVFIAGITGVFSIIESTVGNIQSEIGTSRKKAVTHTLLLTGMLSLLFCMGNGLYLLGALEPMVLGIGMLISGILEIALFFSKKSLFLPTFLQWTGFSPRFVSILRYAFVSLLAVILFGTIEKELSAIVSLDLELFIRWGFLIAAIAASALLAYTRKSRSDRLA